MATNLDILFPDAGRRQMVGAALDDAIAAHIAPFAQREEQQQHMLRIECDLRMRVESLYAQERLARQSAEERAVIERSARESAEAMIEQGRARESALHSALAAEQAGRALLEAQSKADDAAPEANDAPAPAINLAPIEAAISELTRSVAAMQKMLGAQRSMPAPAAPPQPATYSCVPRRDGAGVIREIVATPV
jgi:hypothetical protein